MNAPYYVYAKELYSSIKYLNHLARAALLAPCTVAKPKQLLTLDRLLIYKLKAFIATPSHSNAIILVRTASNIMLQLH